MCSREVSNLYNARNWLACVGVSDNFLARTFRGNNLDLLRKENTVHRKRAFGACCWTEWNIGVFETGKCRDSVFC